MVESDGKRPKRVAERIRAELMGMLLRGAVHDPEAAQAHVTEVVMTDDLRLARVYVRVIGDEPTAIRQRAIVKALERARGFLRRELGSKLALRYNPELEFFWDSDVDRALRVEALLAEIERERKERGEP